MEIKARRVGVDHWTPEDFAKEADWLAKAKIITTARRAILVGLGWTLKEGRRYYHGTCSYGTWATSPEGVDMPLCEAFKVVGGLPEYPERPRFTPAPAPTERLEILEYRPLSVPVGLIFYQGFDYGTAEG